MKIIMWLNKKNDPITDGFSKNPEYHLFFELLNKNHDFRFAYGTESHTGKGVFSNVRKYERGRIVPAEPSFSADVIYQFNRMNALSHDFGNTKIINTPEFKEKMSDKMNQYELLGNFFPKTYAVNSLDELTVKAQSIGHPVILKPSRGQKGEGVVYWNLKDSIDGIRINIEKLNSSGYLVQEFIDTSCGIPGVVEGVHDLKLITIGNDIFANLRTPEKENSHICTFYSEYTEIKRENLPSQIIKFNSGIRDVVGSKYQNQIYSVDIGMTNNGPKLFEINTHTAFPYIHFEYTYNFLEKFIKNLEQYSLT